MIVDVRESSRTDSIQSESDTETCSYCRSTSNSSTISTTSSSPSERRVTFANCVEYIDDDNDDDDYDDDELVAQSSGHYTASSVISV